MTDRDAQLRSVYIWVCEGTWRASVDAALSLAPAGARFTLLHVTSADVPAAAHGAYAGHVRAGAPGRGRPRDPAGEDGRHLGRRPARGGRGQARAPLRTARSSGSTRTGRGGSLGGCGSAGRGAGRRPDPARPEEPGQDHPVRRRSCGLPRSAGLARVGTRRGHHSPAATSPSAAESPIPAGSLNRETRTRRATLVAPPSPKVACGSPAQNTTTSAPTGRWSWKYRALPMSRWMQPCDGAVRLPPWKAIPPGAKNTAYGIGSWYSVLM